MSVRLCLAHLIYCSAAPEIRIYWNISKKKLMKTVWTILQFLLRFSRHPTKRIRSWDWVIVSQFGKIILIIILHKKNLFLWQNYCIWFVCRRNSVQKKKKRSFQEMAPTKVIKGTDDRNEVVDVSPSCAASTRLSSNIEMLHKHGDGRSTNIWILWEPDHLLAHTNVGLVGCSQG